MSCGPFEGRQGFCPEAQGTTWAARGSLQAALPSPPQGTVWEPLTRPPLAGSPSRGCARGHPMILSSMGVTSMPGELGDTRIGGWRFALWLLAWGGGRRHRKKGVSVASVTVTETTCFSPFWRESTKTPPKRAQGAGGLLPAPRPPSSLPPGGGGPGGGPSASEGPHNPWTQQLKSHFILTKIRAAQ